MSIQNEITHVQSLARAGIIEDVQLLVHREKNPHPVGQHGVVIRLYMSTEFCQGNESAESQRAETKA